MDNFNNGNNMHVGLYFLIPIIKKYYIFLHSVTKTDDLMIQQESEAKDKSIIRNENQLASIMNGGIGRLGWCIG